jgi:hypothetical protein
MKHWITGVLAAMTLIGAAQAGASIAWEQKRSHDGIVISTGQPSGSRLMAIRGDIRLPGVDMESVLALLRDTPRMTTWWHACREARQIRVSAQEEPLIHLLHHAPAPLMSARDLVLQMTLTHSDQGSARLTMDSRPDALPTRKGFVRVRFFQGIWDIAPQPDGVRVTYDVWLDPVAGMPSWLAERLLLEAPYETLKALRAQLR